MERSLLWVLIDVFLISVWLCLWLSVHPEMEMPGCKTNFCSLLRKLYRMVSLVLYSCVLSLDLQTDWTDFFTYKKDKKIPGVKGHIYQTRKGEQARIIFVLIITSRFPNSTDSPDLFTDVRSDFPSTAWLLWLNPSRRHLNPHRSV